MNMYNIHALYGNDFWYGQNFCVRIQLYLLLYQMKNLVTRNSFISTQLIFAEILHPWSCVTDRSFHSRYIIQIFRIQLGLRDRLNERSGLLDRLGKRYSKWRNSTIHRRITRSDKNVRRELAIRQELRILFAQFVCVGPFDRIFPPLAGQICKRNAPSSIDWHSSTSIMILYGNTSSSIETRLAGKAAYISYNRSCC